MLLADLSPATVLLADLDLMSLWRCVWGGGLGFLIPQVNQRWTHHTLADLATISLTCQLILADSCD